MPWSLFPTSYNKLKQSESAADEPLTGITIRTDRALQRRCLVTSILAGVSVLLNVFLLGFGFLRPDTCDVHRGPYRNASINPDLKVASAYSPILDEVDMQIGLTTINGALHDNTSIYRMPPSPEVDGAWETLTRKGLEVIVVSEADITLSGKDPARSVKVPLSWGHGPDAYFAQVDIFHILHCLNEVRKEIWPEYYYDQPSDRSRRDLKAHCMHILLQNLLCTADVGIISHNWVHNEKFPKSTTMPFPDYSLVKKCRNFDALLEWTIERRVPDWRSKWQQLRVPDDAIVLPGEQYT